MGAKCRIAAVSANVSTEKALWPQSNMLHYIQAVLVCLAFCLEVRRGSLFFPAMAALIASKVIVPTSTAVSSSQSATKCSCGPLSSMVHIKQSQRGLSKNFVGLKSYGSTASSLSCYGNIHDIGELRASTCNSTADKPKRFSAGQARAAAFKVAVLGAAGGIGQPLGLLLKMSPLASSLHLYDIANVNGVAADLSHCNTPAQVVGFTGPEELGECLKGVDLVVIPAGVPRKPGMTRDDLFNINAGIVKKLVEAVAEHAPGAWINIISNPVNSTVPIAAEVLKQKGVYNPKKLFGVTTLDVVRSNTFVAERKNLRLIDVDVPVVGGHAGVTILPLLSKTRPTVEFTAEEVEQLTTRIQDAGTEVVKAKAGAGSATLSMAYAAARFAESCIRAMDGDTDVYECAYIQSELTELPYFASRVKLGKDGIEGVVANDLSNLTDYEKKALEVLKPELKASIEKGINFVKQKSAPAPAAV